MTITVSYTPNRSDLRRAMYEGFRARPIIFALAVGFFVVIPWLAATAGLAMRVAGAPIALWKPLLLLISPPIGFVLFERYMFRMIQGVPMAREGRTYTFTEADVRMTGPGVDSRLEWTMFTRCHSSAHGLFIYSGKLPLVQLPERALSATSRRDLRTLMASKGLELRGSWDVDDA